MLDTENIYLFTPLFLLPVLTQLLASLKPGRLREGDNQVLVCSNLNQGRTFFLNRSTRQSSRSGVRNRILLVRRVRSSWLLALVELYLASTEGC
jgi:hypothetical protein